MLTAARKTVAGVAVLGAAALGGAVISDAATNNSSTASSSGTAPQQGYGQPGAPQGQGGPPPGRHVGSNGQREQALDATTAAKVKKAAEDKVSGGTVERVETDVDTGSPYEAHMRKSDGSEVVVYVDKSFTVTSVASMQHP